MCLPNAPNTCRNSPLIRRKKKSKSLIQPLKCFVAVFSLIQLLNEYVGALDYYLDEPKHFKTSLCIVHAHRSYHHSYHSYTKQCFVCTCIEARAGVWSHKENLGHLKFCLLFNQLFNRGKNSTLSKD